MTTVLLAGVTIFALAALAWAWSRRREIERRAERAEREAAAARELAEVGAAAKELAHDVGNVLTVLQLSLAALDADEPDVTRDTLRDAERASLDLYAIVERWQGLPERPPTRSSAELLGMLVRLFAETGVEIDLRIDSALPARGSDDDTMRVLVRVLFAATRDAIRAREPRLAIEMTNEALRVRHRAPRGSRTEIRAGAAPARAGWMLGASSIERDSDGDEIEILVRPI